MSKIYLIHKWRNQCNGKTGGLIVFYYINDSAAS